MEISIPSILRIKREAVYRIGKYLRKNDMKNIVLLFGEGIKELLSEQLYISLTSSEIKIQHEEIVTDNSVKTLFDSTFTFPLPVDAIVAVGGGKAIDFGKYAAFLLQVPVITIPTSISNDAFASSMASLTIDGRRRTLKAKMPDGVIIDTDIIKKAPKQYIFSGIGDLISNLTAIEDWKRASKKHAEVLNDFAVLISLNAVENFLNYGNKNIDDIEFIRLVCGSLVMSGISMEICGSSRSSSGSEHLVSHAYDRYAKKPSLHGIQVGVATYAISYIQNNKHELIRKTLEETGFFDFVAAHPLDKSDFIKAIEMAITMKSNFYTVLNEDNAVDKLKEFAETDSLMQKLIV